MGVPAEAASPVEAASEEAVSVEEAASEEAAVLDALEPQAARLITMEAASSPLTIFFFIMYSLLIICSTVQAHAGTGKSCTTLRCNLIHYSA